MKATGIVRRIDDLGRVVIPKEIRRTMRIREGDPLEIYTTKDGEVIFKKYSLLGGLEDFAAQFCDTLSHSTEFTAAVTDRDAIIAVAGVGKRELLGKTISEPLERIMEGCERHCEGHARLRMNLLRESAQKFWQMRHRCSRVCAPRMASASAAASLSDILST